MENALLAIVESAYMPMDDGIRRWRDIDIAEFAELARPRDVRQTIERNRQELERHGSLRFQTANPDSAGGRPGTEYWLNFEQAIRLCMWLKTSRAMDVQFAMTKVFAKFQTGIATLPRMELRAIETVVNDAIAPLVAKVDLIQIDVREIKQGINIDRWNFSKQAQVDWHSVIVKYYSCACPSCLEVCIADKNWFLPNCRLDHFYHRHKNLPTQGWPVHHECNVNLEKTEFREARRNAFLEFQRRLAMLIRDKGESGWLFDIA